MASPLGVTSSYITVTPDIATRWLTQYRYAKQRPLRPHHVAQIAQAMRQGVFREGTPVSFAVYGGTPRVKVLINGQHTLSAIVATGISQRLSIEEYRVHGAEDIPMLYASFDVHLRRSATDIFTAHDFGHLHHLTGPCVRSLSSAVPIIVGGFLGATRSKDHPVNLYMSSTYNRLAAMELWITPAQNFFATFVSTNAIPARHQWQLQRAMVAAVGILTFRYQPAAARVFWAQVASREHLTRTMPEYRLINYLDEAQPADSRTAFAYSRGVAAAWNASFRRRPLARGIVPRHPHLPMLIAGTPFNGVHNLLYFCQGAPTWNPIDVDAESPCIKAEKPLHSSHVAAMTS